MYYLGFDIGASSVKAALVCDQKIVKSETSDLPFDLAGLLKIFKEIFKRLTAGLPQEEIGGLGFGWPGVLDLSRQKIIKAPNVSYLDDQPLGELLAGQFPNQIIVLEHDVNCFLLAEKTVGQAKDLKNVVYLTLGSGIGGALLVSGEIIKGAHGAAGEVGHMIIDLSRQLDLEALASNKFILRELGVGSREAEQRLEAGDEATKKVLEQLGRNLGVGLANLINILDPEAIILGGGISSLADILRPGILESLKTWVLAPAAKETPVLFSQMGKLGGALGAALLLLAQEAAGQS
ncbi:MAG: ROK family protein [Patescibacteria group bacterium]